MAITLNQTSITFNDNSTQSTYISDFGELNKITTFSANGTWTKTSGTTKVLVKVQGGGGGSSSYCEAGGGGGYAEKMLDVTSISSVAITIGGGGGAVGYSGAGGDGGTSSFGAYCSASGGYGCNRNYSHSGGHGGVGSGGDINLYGGTGTGHANSCGNGQLGRGGGTPLGNSATSKRDVNPTWGGGAPGTGGCGGSTNANYGGSAGNAGVVIVMEYK